MNADSYCWWKSITYSKLQAHYGIVNAFQQTLGRTYGHHAHVPTPYNDTPTYTNGLFGGTSAYNSGSQTSFGNARPSNNYIAGWDAHDPFMGAHGGMNAVRGDQ